MVNINLYDSNGEIKYFIEILSELYQVWDDLDKDVRDEIVKIILGINNQIKS